MNEWMTGFAAVRLTLDRSLLASPCLLSVCGGKRLVDHNDVNDKWLQNTLKHKFCYILWPCTAFTCYDSVSQNQVSGPPSIWICATWRFWDGIWTLSAMHLGNWQYKRCHPFSKIYSFMYFVTGRLVKGNYASQMLHTHVPTGERMFGFWKCRSFQNVLVIPYNMKNKWSWFSYKVEAFHGKMNSPKIRYL